ncbi:hypothetical protein ACLOJK_039791 [Asimina triloba]
MLCEPAASPSRNELRKQIVDRRRQRWSGRSAEGPRSVQMEQRFEVSTSAGKEEHHITIIVVRSGQEALSLSPYLFCISCDQKQKTRGDEREAAATSAGGRVAKESVCLSCWGPKSQPS